DIEAVIRLHRRMDAITDSHPLITPAKLRFPSDRRRFAGILLAVLSDHCLAPHCARDAAEPLVPATPHVIAVHLHQPARPGHLALIAPRMAAQDWLGSYREFGTLELVIAGMARRISRPESLDGAMAELEALYQPLFDDFREFYPQLQQFAGTRPDIG